MRFVNQYEMTRKRYLLWSTPKFYLHPIFFVYCVIFAVSLFAYFYFKGHDAAQRWITLAVFMMFISIYRGVFFKYMKTDKQFRLTRQNVFKGGKWMCKVEVNAAGVRVLANGKMSNYVKWENIIGFQEGTSFYDLQVKTSLGEDKARLDKEGFTKGDAETFKKYVLEEHPEVPYSKVPRMWDR